MHTSKHFSRGAPLNISFFPRGRLCSSSRRGEGRLYHCTMASPSLSGILYFKHTIGLRSVHTSAQITLCEGKRDQNVSFVISSGVTRGRTAPGDTLQGVTPEGKNCFVGKFTKNSGETRSDRYKRCRVTPCLLYTSDAADE